MEIYRLSLLVANKQASDTVCCTLPSHQSALTVHTVINYSDVSAATVRCALPTQVHYTITQEW
jgi:hypothetical protein